MKPAPPSSKASRPHSGAIMPLATTRATTSATGAASPQNLPLAGVKEINYYPADAGWTLMWTGWNSTAINADLARIHTLGANTVRIFVQPYTFGYPTPTPVMLSRLESLFALAAANQLRVHLTLFDFWDAFVDLSGSEAWARALLAPLLGNHTLSIIEVKNEIDPGDAQAMKWARAMIPFLQNLAGVSVTISVSGTAGVSGLQELKQALGSAQPSFYSFHYYGNAGLARTEVHQAMAVVSPTPLFVGEFGASSLNPNSSVAGDARQDLYIRSVAAAVKSLGLPDPAPWTLNDFANGAIPSATLAADPDEYAMGLLNVDGSAKPAAASISQLFTQDSVDASFNNGFESGYNAPSATRSLPTDWSIFDPSQGGFGRDTSVSHSGSASVRLSDTSGSSAQVPSFGITPPNGWVIPGSVYTASVWARGANATGYNRLAVAWFNASGSYIGENESNGIGNGTTPWTLLTVSAMAPVGAAHVQIHLKSAYNSGSVWFDDVSWSG